MSTDQTAILQGALDALPTDPDAIAEFFRERGITGRRTVPCACPIANYLKRELGTEDDSLSVTVGAAWAYKENRKGPDDWFRLPKAARKFVEWFDDGAYVDLLDR